MNTILFLSILIKLLLASLSLAASNELDGSPNDEDYSIIDDNYYENRSGINDEDYSDKKNKVSFNKSSVLDFIFPALFNHCAFNCKYPNSMNFFYGLSFNFS